MNKQAAQQSGVVTSAAAANYAYHQHIEMLPYELMKNEWDRYVEAAGDVNKWAFPPIATADHNPTAKMSPDVLVSALSYDVTDGPLHLSLPISREPFWSLTLFQENTDNFFGIDDRAVEGETFQLIILGPNQTAPADQNARVVASPSHTGIAVVRCVVPSADAQKKLDRLRKRAKAGPVKSA